MSNNFYFLAGILSFGLIGYAAQTLRTGVARNDSIATDVAFGVGAATSLVALVAWLSNIAISTGLAFGLLIIAAALGGAAAYALNRLPDSTTGVLANGAIAMLVVVAVVWGWRAAVFIDHQGLLRFLLQMLAAGVVLGLLYVVVTMLVSIVRVARQRSRDKASGQLAPLLRDSKVLAILAQLVFLVIAIGVIWFLRNNFVARTTSIGLKLNFRFLEDPAGITIADGPLSPADTVSRAIVAGLFNTLRVIIVGIPLALILGTLIGIARLSSNWLLSKLATGYVEFFRNLPPVVVIIFIWSGVYLTFFPAATESWRPLGGWTIFNNSRFGFPSFVGRENWDIYRWILLAAVVIAIGVAVWRTQVFNRTGHAHHRVLWGVGTFVVIAGIGYVAFGGPLAFSKPELTADGRSFSGGIFMQMPYAALVTGLVLYTASHIAEIMRGSILAVDKGQVEAAEAVALSGFQRYRFVVLPQALRIAFPALINQLLNFTKNSSLALAVAFQEVTSIIKNLQGQSLPAPQLILILMLVYLTLSLLISALGNFINGRLQIVGR